MASCTPSSTPSRRATALNFVDSGPSRPSSVRLVPLAIRAPTSRFGSRVGWRPSLNPPRNFGVASRTKAPTASLEETHNGYLVCVLRSGDVCLRRGV